MSALSRTSRRFGCRRRTCQAHVRLVRVRVVAPLPHAMHRIFRANASRLLLSRVSCGEIRSCDGLNKPKGDECRSPSDTHHKRANDSTPIPSLIHSLVAARISIIECVSSTSVDDKRIEQNIFSHPTPSDLMHRSLYSYFDRECCTRVGA